MPYLKIPKISISIFEKGTILFIFLMYLISSFWKIRRQNFIIVNSTTFKLINKFMNF